MATPTESQGGAFGAPVESDGTTQAQVDRAALVVLPGGVALVNQAGPFADASWLGRPVSGPILCNERREP
jgi:hypothetical protein